MFKTKRVILQMSALLLKAACMTIKISQERNLLKTYELWLHENRLISEASLMFKELES